MTNETNVSFINVTDNSTFPAVYALGPPLATISSISIVIGTSFSILSILRYLRRSHLRNHYTYLFHGILIFCLLSSFLNVPIFLAGYYLKTFETSPSVCRYYMVNAISVFVGVLSCLAYASVERNYFIFRKNPPLTWRRQITPMICLIFYSYFVAILFTFVPQCELISCTACHSRQMNPQLVWLTVTFLLPELIMFSSALVLIVRLYRQRRRFPRAKDRRIFIRIAVQMLFYVLWSCLYYCPPSFYNLSLLLNSSQSSPTTKSAMIIVSTVSMQTYPLLTFVLMSNVHRRIYLKNNNEVGHPNENLQQNESIWKIHVRSTFTDPMNNSSR